jgi:hypothetical protein
VSDQNEGALCPLCISNEKLIVNAVKQAVNATLDAAAEKMKNALWMAGVSEYSIQIAAESLEEFRQ